MEVVASLSQGRTAAAQCGLFTHKSVPVIFEPPCIILDKDQLDTHLLYFKIRLLSSSTCFEHYMLIIKSLNFIDAASVIFTLSEWLSGAQVERELHSDDEHILRNARNM